MRKFSDESGWVRAAVCFAALLFHHGIRDSLITALPTLAASDGSETSTTPDIPTTTTTTTELPPTGLLLPVSQEPADFTRLRVVEGSVYPSKKANLTLNTKHSLLTAFENGKQGEGQLEGGPNSDGTVHRPPVFHNLAGSKAETSNAVLKTRPSLSSASSPMQEALGLSGARKEESDRSGMLSSLLGHPSRIQRTKTDEESSEVADDVSKVVRKGESVISRPPLYVVRDRKDTSLPHKGLKTEEPIHRLLRSIETHLKEPYDRNDIHNLIRGGGSEHLQEKDREKTPAATSEEDSPFGQRQGGAGDLDEQLVEKVEERTARTSSVEGHQFKEEWSLGVEGLVLSSVFWAWLFTALLADTVIDKVGAVRVLAVSMGVVGLFGLLTHAVSQGGPWALLGFRVVQGAFQGVSYPAVVRVLEGVPSSGRASRAVLVYMGPCLGTGLGAGMGSLSKWYVATYVLGSLAVAFTPLCRLLPPPPEKAPHKEMQWEQVLGCRGVWACVGVHLANTWMIHTLLLGLPFCLTYTPLDKQAAGGWVVAVGAVVVGVVMRADLLFATKVSTKRPLSVLTRRRVPVVLGTVMVLAAVITMATAGLDSFEVLVGVGIGLAGLGVGGARVGYRLNVDDVAPLGAWRVTRVLDTVAVLAAAAVPLALCGLAEVGRSGWVAVWLVPLFALVPSAVAYLFLLTSNQQPWDQKGEASNGVVANGTAGGVPVSPVNGVGPAFSVGRQSFKSAVSGVTFKTARSRSRTRTGSCRTIDDDLEGDMQSAVGTNSVDCRSVVEEADPECVSVASSSTFKSDGADMHSVVDEGDGAAAAVKQKPGQQFGSMLVNGGTTDRTSAWLSSHHDIVLEAEQAPTRAGTHAANAIYGLVW